MKKKSIIWISPESPLPANTGGKIVTWNRILNLSQEYNIYLFTIHRDETAEDVRQLREVCNEVKVYARNRSLITYAKSIVYPFPAISRWNSEMRDEILACYKKENIDVIIVDFPQMIGVVPKELLKDSCVILNQHNIEWKTGLDIAKGVKNPLKRFAHLYTSFELKHYEGNLYRRQVINGYTFVSSEDMAFFEKRYGIKNTILSPIGSTIHDYPSLSSNQHQCIFVANYSYAPNEEAALWLITEIWPKVICKIKDAELFLVGRDPSEKMYEAVKAYESIHITGGVKSVDEYYNMCNITVIPIRYGGGVKVKVLEALGHGKIVVSTIKTIEGTLIENNKHVRASESSEKIANLCVEAMENPQKFENVRRNGYNLIVEKYSWQSIMKEYGSYIVELL